MKDIRTFGFRIICRFGLLIMAILVNTFLSNKRLTRLEAAEKEGKTLLLTDVPEDYIRIKSGLGEDHPRCLLIVARGLQSLTD